MNSGRRDTAKKRGRMVTTKASGPVSFLASATEVGMADRLYGDVVADSTGISIALLLRSSVDNSRLTGVAAGSVVAQYFRQGDAAPTAITATPLSSANAAWAAGGWREISAASMPGWYRFDIPNGAFAAGADWVALQVSVAGTFGFDIPYRLQSAALVADQILKRDLGAVEAVTSAAGRSLLNAIRLLRNRWSTTPTTITVYKEDDATPAWTGALSTAVGAAQITSVDPT